MNSEHELTESIQAGDPETLEALAECLSQAGVGNDSSLLPALGSVSVRRWVRGYLLERLEPDQRSWLASRLLAWSSDLDPSRRDRSMVTLINALNDEQVEQSLTLLAGGNAAGALWKRLSKSGESTVMRAADQILGSGDVRARETTLHLLVLDPFGPGYLSHDNQDTLLVRALDDPDPEIRGLAAEVIAAELPDVLLSRWDTALLDEGERVRMAFWRAAMAHQPQQAIESAQRLVLDPEQSHTARRTALLSLGETVPTRDVSSILQLMLRGDDEVLASDAARLMWRHHRTPDIANAAAESQFDEVRTQADRLLHPEMGSPAAGGSRPGDPTRTQQIFDQITPKDDRSG